VIQLGEAAYMRRAGQEALAWIVAHPSRFLQLAAQRIIILWFGPLYRPASAVGVSLLTILALGGAWVKLRSLSPPQQAALFIPLLAYPLIYYIVAYMPSYRAPIDWILYILAGSAIARLAGAAGGRLASSLPPMPVPGA
jgi:hypothetical protein